MRDEITSAAATIANWRITDHLARTLSPFNRVALALSGGTDSLALMFALLQIEQPFTAYTFHCEGVHSTDLQRSIEACQAFNVTQHIITLPSDVDTIYHDCLATIPYCRNKVTKTKVETLRPLLYLFDQVKEDIIINGDGGGDLQPTGRKVNMFLKEHGEEAFREAGFRDMEDLKADGLNGTRDHYRCYMDLAEDRSKEYICGYRSDSIFDYYKKFTMRALMSPEKALTVRAFQDCFDIIKPVPHSAYQLNSGLAKQHEQLLQSRYNTTGVYNQMKRDLESIQEQINF
jgi:asparagine synthetase B (glutamine-hydrolysing)